MKILIVDDNVDSVESASELLRVCGHATELAYSGYGAQVLLNQRTFDAVMLDHRITDLSGLDLIRWMRFHHIPTPAVMTTGVAPDIVDSIKASVEAEKLGAVVVLGKPYEVEALLAALEAFCKPPEVVTTVTQTVQKTLTVSQETK